MRLVARQLEHESLDDARRPSIAVVERVDGDEVEMDERRLVVCVQPLVGSVEPVNVLLHERLDALGRRRAEDGALGSPVHGEVLFGPIAAGVVVARQGLGHDEVDGLTVSSERRGDGEAARLSAYCIAS